MNKQLVCIIFFSILYLGHGITQKPVFAISCNPSQDGEIYTLTEDCSFSGTVNGVDAGSGTTNTAKLVVSKNKTLTIGNTQNVAVGTLLIEEGANVILPTGGSVYLGAPLWVDTNGEREEISFLEVAGKIRKHAYVPYVCTPGVDCQCWSSDGTTCDTACAVSSTTKSATAYPISCTCAGGNCGCRCVGDCWASATYPNNCRGKMCWGECSGNYSCAVSSKYFVYTGSGTCASLGTGNCYKLTEQITYYTRTANCCGTSATCNCGSPQTGYTSYQSCTYIP